MTTGNTIRTRIAPSPTGDPHLGTAYIALFNWAFARSQGGQFLVRIEDTDQARSTRSSENMILSALAWLGIDWDEGPDIGGGYAPYRQSERKDTYAQYTRQLLDQGHAFTCFCSPERLEAVRAEQRAAGANPKYDGHCIRLSKDEVVRRQAAGEPSVVRMKVPEEGICRFVDELRGEIEIPWAQVDMQVILKADGMPTYHLAVVVDDHLMGITHILRGEEWINSVPKHVLLAGYFGWELPTLVHMPLLRNPDQSKLSKRKNPTSVNYYRDAGYLPEALVNYLGMMGWSMPDEREIFSVSEMVEAFDLARISLGGPIFDREKLNWLNGQYIRAMTDDGFLDAVTRWAINRERLKKLVPLIKERTERFDDLVPQVDYLLGNRRPLVREDFAQLKLDTDQVVRIVDHTLRQFDSLRDWRRDDVFETCQTLAKAMNLQLKVFLGPLFMAISGRAVSLPLFDSMIFLGADITRMRMREALAALNVSGKQAKRLEKAYAELIDELDSEDED